MEKFSVHLPNGSFLLGRTWVAEHPVRNLLILEGMNEHSLRYQDLALYLNSVGVNVSVLDSFGQGLNAPSVFELEHWPVGAFDSNVLAAFTKINELKEATKLPTSLMGHSMGSFMAQRYLELYPKTANSVILCGSNGPALLKMTMAYILASAITFKNNWDEPSIFLDNMILGAYAKAIKNRRTDLDWLSYNTENVDAYIQDPFCGRPDTHGFWKEFLRGMKELYKKKNLAKISVEEKILIISGAEHPVGEFGKGPMKLAEMYKKIGVKEVSLIIYPGMRHEIHNEKGHLKVYKDISDFLLN
jgi:alpha-beta hydrolase superfamily lysophospholipase